MQALFRRGHGSPTLAQTFCVRVRAEATGLRWAKPTFVGWEHTVLVVSGQQAARHGAHVLVRWRGHLPVMGGRRSHCAEHAHLSGARHSAHEGGLCLA